MMLRVLHNFFLLTDDPLSFSNICNQPLKITINQIHSDLIKMRPRYVTELHMLFNHTSTGSNRHH